MIRNLPLEIFPPIAKTTPAIMRDAVTAVETYRSFVLAGNWDLVHAQIIPLAGYADILLRIIQIRTELYEHGADFLSKQDSFFKKAFADLKTDNSAKADTVRSAMLNEFTKSLGNEAAAQKLLEGLMEGDNPLFSRRANKKSRLSKEQDLLVATQVLLTTVAHRASIESSVSSSFNMVEGMGGSSEGDGDISIISNESSALGVMHDAIIEELFHALTSNTEQQLFVNLCVGRQAQIAMRLPTSALLVGGYLGFLSRKDPEHQTINKLSQAVLTLVERIKRLSLIHAYLSLVHAEAATLDAGRWYSSEKKRATSRQMKSQVPSGQAVDSVAIFDGSIVEGDFIQIEGIVAIDDGDLFSRKFSSSSFFWLWDLSVEAAIRIRAPRFSLANNGLSGGAIVRLNGFVRTNPSWSDTFGIDIDRVSLRELGKSSWYDDVTHRVRRSFLLYQDGMNMFFTPEVWKN